MIKINVLRSLPQQRLHEEMLAAVETFTREREAKSFSERHPELGKMINCVVCLQRHRKARVCVSVYAKTPDEVFVGEGGKVTLVPVTTRNEDGSVIPKPMLADQNTAKGVMGAARFAGRRNKHRNAWGLQVLERAAIIFNQDRRFYGEMTEEDENKLGKQSLSRALNEKRAERAMSRRVRFLITRESRKLNRGIR